MKKQDELIVCSCGCGTKLKKFDEHYRKRKYVNGHNGRKYDNPSQYKREWNHRNREARYEYRKDWTHRKKSELIKSLGGKCDKCGLLYDGSNASVFDFHHTDDKKEHGVNLTALARFSFEKIKSEAEKCIILCSNCHRLNHSSSY